MDNNPYGLINQKVIYQYTTPKSNHKFEIFEKSFPTNPIKSVKFHIVPTGQDVKIAAPMTIKDEVEANKNIFILDLTDERIGSYFFAGLIVDSVSEFDNFITDLKAGKICIGVINIEHTGIPNTIGMLIEQLTTLCGNNTSPIAHIFLKENELVDTARYINESMTEYFVKDHGEIMGVK